MLPQKDIIHLQSMGDGFSKESTTMASIEVAKTEERASSLQVSFGSVQVHHHPLTLGCNPGGSTSTGPPLTLHWDSFGSDHYPTIEDFSAEFHQHKSRDAPVYRIIGSKRREIAAEEHSPEAIAAVEAEIRQIREARFMSSMDPPEGSVKELLLNARQSREASKKNKSRGIFSRLRARR
jgi:hypothetical protein